MNTFTDPVSLFSFMLLLIYLFKSYSVIKKPKTLKVHSSQPCCFLHAFNQSSFHWTTGRLLLCHILATHSWVSSTCLLIFRVTCRWRMAGLGQAWFRMLWMKPHWTGFWPQAQISQVQYSQIWQFLNHESSWWRMKHPGLNRLYILQIKSFNSLNVSQAKLWLIGSAH